MRKSGIRKKLYRLTYDQPNIHKKILQISCSLEEVKKLLENMGHKKSRT